MRAAAKKISGLYFPGELYFLSKVIQRVKKENEKILGKPWFYCGFTPDKYPRSEYVLFTEPGHGLKSEQFPRHYFSNPP